MDFFPREAIAPTVTGIFLVITGVIAFITSRRNAKTGAREQRAPDVQQMWAQQESDRHARRVAEDLWWNLRRAFQSYFRRVQAGGSHELTPKEQAAIDAKPPED